MLCLSVVDCANGASLLTSCLECVATCKRLIINNNNNKRGVSISDCGCGSVVCECIVCCNVCVINILDVCHIYCQQSKLIVQRKRNFGNVHNSQIAVCGSYDSWIVQMKYFLWCYKKQQQQSEVTQFSCWLLLSKSPSTTTISQATHHLTISHCFHRHSCLQALTFAKHNTQLTHNAHTTKTNNECKVENTTHTHPTHTQPNTGKWWPTRSNSFDRWLPPNSHITK